jgi:hypothetical protein
MRRNLEQRLLAVEAARAASAPIRLWIDRGDGTIVGPDGEVAPRSSFDGPTRREVSGELAILITETQARY